MKALVLETATFKISYVNLPVEEGSVEFTAGQSTHVFVDDTAAMRKGSSISVSGVSTNDGFVQGVPVVGVFPTGSVHIRDVVGLLLDDASVDLTLAGVRGNSAAQITVTVSIDDPGQSKAGEV